MTDMRATERLLEFIGGQSDDPKITAAVAELRRRGDTLVRRDDLRVIAAAANHGRKYGQGGDTDYTGFEAALERIEDALGGT
ncbi:MAG TPA: hypothetical protein VGO31_01735 [Microbacteriaceae bacterium]|jgi:hypothetical protein|nr:hypothetical protein [Microbacteriaceae bacterium]